MIGMLILLVIVLIAITVHEASHALVADMLGDPTPRLAGRLTLNPINHIDPIGFIMLLLVRFGWAKPVPINPYNFSDPQKGQMLVSIAGPASNFLLAWFMATLIRFLPFSISTNGFVVFAISNFIYINLALAVFNLIPIPPLDGSHIFEPFLPDEVRNTLEQYGFMILVLILMYPPTSMLLMRVIQFIFDLIT